MHLLLWGLFIVMKWDFYLIHIHFITIGAFFLSKIVKMGFLFDVNLCVFISMILFMVRNF